MTKCMNDEERAAVLKIRERARQLAEWEAARAARLDAVPRAIAAFVALDPDARVALRRMLNCETGPGTYDIREEDVRCLSDAELAKAMGFATRGL